MNMHVGGSKFKVGDRVKCIDADCALSELAAGAVYQVSGFNYGDIRLDGVRSSWRASRFEPVASFKVGDRVRVVRHCNWKGDEIPMGIPTGEVRQIVKKTDQLANEGVETFSLEGDNRFFYTPLNLELATLRIEAGKFYKTRDGRKVGPMKRWGGSLHPWEQDGNQRMFNANGDIWRTDGTSGYSPELIAEWQDEPAAAPAKFRVGDRVTQDHWGERDHATVIRVGDGSIAIKDDRGNVGTYSHVEYFKLASDTAASTAIVCLIENGRPKPSTLPFVHADRAAALKEASRLSNIHKGSEFGVFECVDVKQVELPAKVYDFEWQRLAADGKKLLAIKELRGMTGIGLAIARDAVEDWLRHN